MGPAPHAGLGWACLAALERQSQVGPRGCVWITEAGVSIVLSCFRSQSPLEAAEGPETPIGCCRRQDSLLQVGFGHHV